jgi:hypothetical protein
MRQLWLDDKGSGLVSMEIVFLGTLLVLGLITGWVGLRNVINNELQELASAYGALSQSYSFAGLSGCAANTAGSATRPEDCDQTRIKGTSAQRCDIDGNPCDESD